MHGRGDAVLGIMFMGVSWRWKKVSSAWFAGAAFFCVRSSARCWFCLLSLIVCELLRGDVTWDVGSKKDFPWSFCESDWDCHAKGSTTLSNSRERREVWWCLSFKGLSAGEMCPDEMVKICLPQEMWVVQGVSYCGSGLSGVWHLI